LSGCRHVDAAMVLTGAQKEYIVRNYRLPPEKLVVIGAGYNDSLFTTGAKPTPRPVQLVYAGKLLNAKGLPWLLKALKTITTPEWQMHIVGDGSGKEKEECMRLAQDLGERVVVHGQIPQARLAALFNNAHVFVLPSLFEGLPLVVIEALASGCRVVATDLPGVMEVVGNIKADYITLVRTPRLRKMDQPYPEDLAAFEQNIAQALTIQMEGAISRPHIDLSLIADELAAFTWKRVFDRVQSVYFNVLYH